MKILLRISLFLSVIFIIIACSGKKINRESSNIRFAVLCNTSPVSPFTGFTERLSRVVEEINKENPVFVVHLGNMVHGGYMWMGIKEKDIHRQFKIYFSKMSKLNSVLYTVAGDMDKLDDSLKIYKKYSGRKPYYSFNYGLLHFIILNTVGKSSEIIDQEQMKWLEKDLEIYKKSSIFVFMHHSLLVKRQKIEMLDKGNKLHRLLSGYRIKAVFSGNLSGFHEFGKDNIHYFTTGCGGYTRENRYKRYKEYYLINYNGVELNIEGREIPFTNSR